MAPKKIEVIGIGLVKLGSEKGYHHWLGRHGATSLLDDENCQVDFESLVAGGTYTLGPLIQQQQQQQELEEKTKELEEKTKELEETKKILKASRQLGRGEYFTQISKILETRKVEYKNTFEQICGRMRDEEWQQSREKICAYGSLVQELVFKANAPSVTADALTLTSQSVQDRELDGDNLTPEERKLKETRGINKASRKKLGKQIKKNPDELKPNIRLADEGVVTNSAHLLPNNKTCSVTMGILVQAIVGHDFEGDMNKFIEIKSESEPNVNLDELKQKKIKLLQQLAFHKKLPYKGFCHLACNQVNLPKSGHENFFDVKPRWLIVPVIPLGEILQWNPNKGEQSSYWVMVLCGDLHNEDEKAYLNFIQANQDKDDENPVYSDGKRERCTEMEIKIGIENISVFVQAIADLATGRGDGMITPFDLLPCNTENNIEKYAKACKKIYDQNTVTLPKLKEDLQYEQIQVMKLKIKHTNPEKLTEPMALCVKAALNFMDFNDEKCVPACAEEHGSDEESSDTESSEEVDIGFHFSVGSTLTCRPDIPQYVAIVTPPHTPPCNLERRDSADSGDL